MENVFRWFLIWMLAMAIVAVVGVYGTSVLTTA